MTKRLPTDTELLINERIMGGCNHPDHTTETKREDGHDYRYLICTKCGQRFWDDEYLVPWEKETKNPKDYLRKFVPLYCEDVVMARAIVRHLEAKDWKPFMRTENGKYRYSFSKGTVTIEGGLENSEHAAICSAAEKLVKQTP